MPPRPRRRAPVWRPGSAARARARAHALRGGMAARPRAHRLSLERARLRADLAAAADAERGARRHLRADAAGGPHLRRARWSVGAERAGPARSAPLRWRSASRSCRCSLLFGYGAPAAVRRTAARADGVQLPHRAAERPAAREMAAREPARIFDEHLELSRQNAAGGARRLAGITHVIWPEAAMPFLPLEHPEALAAIGELLPAGTPCSSGRAARREPNAVGRRASAASAFNSLIVFDDGGELADALRQDPPRALRRVSAVPADARGARPRAAHAPARRLHAGPDPAPAAQRAGPAAVRPAHLLRGDLSRPRSCRATSARACCSTSPTTAGSATRRGRTSIFIRRACARSRRACRWCAPPTTASPPLSTAQRPGDCAASGSTPRRDRQSLAGCCRADALMHAIGDWIFRSLVGVILLRDVVPEAGAT